MKIADQQSKEHDIEIRKMAWTLESLESLSSPWR